MKTHALHTGRKLRPGYMTAFRARPRLSLSLLIGLIAALACGRFTPLEWSTAAIVGWDVTSLVFIVVMLATMGRTGAPATIRATAVTQDEGRGFILGLVTVAAGASLWAVAAELALAKSGGRSHEAMRVGLAFGTVALSWFMVQLIYALHYAHEYYAPDQTAGGEPQDAGGLAFPGDAPPDYWDFLHFSIVIGVASQTADIAFTSKAIRRVGTVHSVLAFLFNTVVLALTINLLASLF